MLGLLLIEQTLIPDDCLTVTNHSIYDESSEKGFACKGDQGGCCSSQGKEDPEQTIMQRPEHCWTCYSRTKMSKVVKGTAVFVTAATRYATREPANGKVTYSTHISLGTMARRR